MHLRKLLTTLILIALFAMYSSAAQGQTKTYSETRKLLLQMERRSGSKALKKLFEESNRRMPDLIQALIDEDERVKVNSQYILLYLDEKKVLTASKEWAEYHQKKSTQSQSYSKAKMELLAEIEDVSDGDQNLEKFIRKKLDVFNSRRKDFYAKLIAYNKERKTALIELVEGEIFTTGWHIVIRQEGSQWRLVSDNLVWNT